MQWLLLVLVLQGGPDDFFMRTVWVNSEATCRELGNYELSKPEVKATWCVASNQIFTYTPIPKTPTAPKKGVNL